MKTKLIFDTILQQEVEHELYVDGNGEIVAQSTLSDHFIKFPHGLTREEVLSLIDAHKEANLGQVSAEAANAKLEVSQALIDEL